MSNMVEITSGRMKGCAAILLGEVANDDAPAYGVKLISVTQDAYKRGFRIGDEYDIDKHEFKEV